jgi:hypothetical protein
MQSESLTIASLGAVDATNVVVSTNAGIGVNIGPKIHFSERVAVAASLSDGFRQILHGPFKTFFEHV